MSFLIYVVNRRGLGHFIMGESDHPHDLGGTPDPDLARTYKSKAAAAKVIEAVARLGHDYHILRHVESIKD
ncbi:hypothetical protein YA0089_26215 [Pseudomonas viridiflava]|uniref:hypothetical protein n=1 Tax=Pseudomonas viridiflava TaxID=33069 RepID=UPI0018E5B65C|nr:hypothetical protein [Pseudomonas viridiflava]MBI6727111.1 hypothetical protein [Pseudomonas viridiflava]